MPVPAPVTTATFCAAIPSSECKFGGILKAWTVRRNAPMRRVDAALDRSRQLVSTWASCQLVGGNPMRRRDLLASGLAALAAPALLPRAAFSQAKYPDRPVRLIVPFPPGGAFDTIGRPWADRIKSHLGTDGDREYRRRRRRRRRGAGVALAARRLHAAARRRDHPHHRGAAQDQADLRSAQGPGADLADRGHGVRDRGPSVGAGQGPQGVHRLRQGQPRQDVLRLGRPRLAQSSHRRTVQAARRAQPTCRTCPIAAPGRD